MHRLFTCYPKPLARTARISEACRFSLDKLEHARSVTIPLSTPKPPFDRLTWEGAA